MTVYRHRQKLQESRVLEPESVTGGSNEPVLQDGENDGQGDLFDEEGESESTSTNTQVDPEQYIRQARELSADYPDGPDQEAETAEESEGESTDIVASSPTDPATIRLRQENEDKKAYAEIVLWLNTYARDLGGFNLTFNGLIRKYGVPQIATALEVLNTEHRVGDLATQCYLILEKIEKIGGKVDGEQVLTVAE